MSKNQSNSGGGSAAAKQTLGVRLSEVSASERPNLHVLANAFRAAMKEQQFVRAKLVQNALRAHPDGINPTRSRDVPMMAWSSSGISNLKDQRCLFVSGVPRSGTTALGRLLGQHEDVAMYIELYPPTYGYVPEMLDHRAVRMLADRNILRLGKMHDAVLAKSVHSRFVGDKRPGFMVSAELTFMNFIPDNIRVVHIVRNIDEVAVSYQRRYDAGTWARNFEVAIQDANLSNRLAARLLATEFGRSMIVLDYHQFWRAAGNIRWLFAKLDLPSGGIDCKSIEFFVKKAQHVWGRRENLTMAERALIEEHYDALLEDELREWARLHQSE